MQSSIILLSGRVALTSALALGCADQPSPIEPTNAAPPPVSAAQASPTQVDPTPFLLEGFCPFNIQGVAAGKAKTVALPGGRVVALSPGLTWTLTNLDTGRSETFVITGAFHFSTLESGAVQLVVTGRNILGAPGSGLSLVVGRQVLIFDPESQLFLPVAEAHGRVVDLCQFLA